MNLNEVEIVQSLELAHQYLQITIHAPNLSIALPGQYIETPSLRALSEAIQSVDKTWIASSKTPRNDGGGPRSLQVEKLFIMDQRSQHYDLLIPPSLSVKFKNLKILKISDLLGTSMPSPDNQQFYLLEVEIEYFAAAIFYLKKYRKLFQGLILFGSPDFYPFLPCPSRKIIPGFTQDVIAGIPLLEDWGISHRLASLKDQPGIFQGTVNSLADLWLQKAALKIPIERIYMG